MTTDPALQKIKESYALMKKLHSVRKVQESINTTNEVDL
jgi:hypothetical protein